MTPPKARRLHSGLTLIELTVVIVVLITLIGVMFVAAGRYAYHADRAGCIVAQDQLKKAVISHANIMQEPLRQGIDYYGNEDIKAFLNKTPTCPDTGGGYSVYLAPSGADLIVTCTDHIHDHHQ